MQDLRDLQKCSEISKKLRVLSHPYRLFIVKGLIQCGGCHVNFIKDCLQVPQPVISQHLMALKKAGIVQDEIQGNLRKYHVCDKEALSWINSFLNNQ